MNCVVTISLLFCVFFVPCQLSLPSETCNGMYYYQQSICGLSRGEKASEHAVDKNEAYTMNWLRKIDRSNTWTVPNHAVNPFRCHFIFIYFSHWIRWMCAKWMTAINPNSSSSMKKRWLVFVSQTYLHGTIEKSSQMECWKLAKNFGTKKQLILDYWRWRWSKPTNTSIKRKKTIFLTEKKFP